MKKIVATALLAAGMVVGGATVAQAAPVSTYTGVVDHVGYKSTGVPYIIGLTTKYENIYMLADTQIYNCNSAGVPTGTLINSNNLMKLKSNSEKVRIDFYTYSRDTITCV